VQKVGFVKYKFGKCVTHDFYNNSVAHKNKAVQTGSSLLS